MSNLLHLIFFFHVLSFQVYSILVQKFQPDSTSLYAVCF